MDPPAFNTRSRSQAPSGNNSDNNGTHADDGDAVSPDASDALPETFGTPHETSESHNPFTGYTSPVHSSSGTFPYQHHVAAIKVNPTPYKGEGVNIKQWLTKYNAIAAINEWDDAAKLVYLPVFLEGKPFDLFSSFVTNQTTWASASQFLTRMFGVTDNPLLNFELLNAVRQDSRTVKEYAGDVTRLAAKVDPTMSDATRIRHFLVGLRPSLKERILPHVQGLTAFDDLVDTCERFEQALAPSSYPTNAVSMDTLEHIISKMMDAKLGNTDVAAISRRPPPPRTSSSPASFSSPSRRVCNYCKRPGHVIAECRTRQRNNNARNGSSSNPPFRRPLN